MKTRILGTSSCPIPSSNNSRDVNDFAWRMLLDFPIEALKLSEQAEPDNHAERTEQNVPFTLTVNNNYPVHTMITKPRPLKLTQREAPT